METRRNFFKGMVFIVAATFFWSASSPYSYVLMKTSFSPVQITSFRAVFAVIIFGAIATIRGELCCLRAKDLWRFAVLGIMIMPALNLSYFSAIDTIGVTLSVILIYTYPFFLLVHGYFSRKEHVSSLKMTSFLIALLGITLIVRFSFGEGSSLKGLGLGVISAVVYAVYTLMSKRLTGYYAPTTILLYTFMFSLITFIILLRKDLFAVVELNKASLLDMLKFTVLSAVLPYYCYVTALRYIPPATASIMAMLEPFMTGALSYFLLHETLTYPQWAGGGLIIIALFLLYRGEARNNNSREM